MRTETSWPAPAVQAQGAPALEQELSDFTYMVSHDLAASFRHITGFSDLLARNLNDVPSKDQSVYIGLIRDAARKCESMLEQLCVYSRLLNAPLRVQDCDVAKMLDIVRLQLSGQIRQCGAQFEIGPLEGVHADPELVTQGLECIIDNAVKFRRTGVIPRITITQIPDDASWKIAIRDNGIGVSQAEAEKHFAMFHRGHAEGAYPGTGAGLTIARRIFRRQGGDIRFVECDEGACIEVTLPHAEASMRDNAA